MRFEAAVAKCQNGATAELKDEGWGKGWMWMWLKKDILFTSTLESYPLFVIGFQSFAVASTFLFDSNRVATRILPFLL